MVKDFHKFDLCKLSLKIEICHLAEAEILVSREVALEQQC